MKANKIIQDFKEFAVKGNMIDIAIGVIIGTAFNKVVDALVKEIFLPPLSFLTDGVNWENKRIILREAILENNVIQREEIAIGYGKLSEAFVDFFIIAITVFFVIKFIKAIQDRAEDPQDTSVKTPKDIELLNEMKELLKRQNELIEGQKKE